MMIIDKTDSLKYKLGTGATIQKSDRKIKPMLLPDKPEENWAYKGRKLNPIYIYLRCQYFS